MLSSERCHRMRNLKVSSLMLFPSVFFLSDPWVPVNTQGSRPHIKPGAIKMSNLSVFPLQTSQPKWGSREVLRASSEPETQCEYNHNELIIPITIYTDGHCAITFWVAFQYYYCPVCLVTTAFIVSGWELGLYQAQRFVCVSSINQLQRTGQGK